MSDFLAVGGTTALSRTCPQWFILLAKEPHFYRINGSSHPTSPVNGSRVPKPYSTGRCATQKDYCKLKQFAVVITRLKFLQLTNRECDNIILPWSNHNCHVLIFICWTK